MREKIWDFIFFEIGEINHLFSLENDDEGSGMIQILF